MAQATIELPDPHTASPPISADDLLSKLAGDEIDRLLAEAEKGPGSDRSIGSALANPVDANEPRAAAAENVDAAAQAQLDELFDQLSGATGEKTKEKPPVTQSKPAPAISAATTITEPTPYEAALGSQKEPLPNEPPIEASLVSDSADAVTAEIAPMQADVAPAAVETGPIASPAHDAASLDAELVQTLGDVSPPDAPSKPATQSPTTSPVPPAEKPPREPVFVKILELINAPLASADSATRELLGKIAIVTAFNAIVVLIYVMFFR